ncbi:MAG: TIGR03750 family conjugal transfer protein [Gammaproteobacteria bacterium]|nr:TIGR03750 family conjugal transfer protein [Gammaproteobacteria bacterium]
MASQKSNDHLLAGHLDTEPVIFRGCSSSELGFILAVAAAAWLPLSFLFAGLLGALTMGAGIAVVGVLATVFLTATVFQRLKRGRPDGYYQQRLRLGLEDMGLLRSGFVRRGGAWDIGRTYRAVPQGDR